MRSLALAAWILLAPQLSPPRVLDALDRAAGWVSLSEPGGEFTPKTLPAGWSVEDGAIRRAAGASEPLALGPVLAHFELEFDWRETAAPEAAFRHGRIVARPNGSALALLAGERLDRAATSDLPSFRAGPFELTPAQAQPGWHIALRPGDVPLELRAIRVRDQERLPGTEVLLFDGRTLRGWRALGDAKYTVQDGELVGEVGGGSQSFLCTEREFGDFLLEVELKNELSGNSGIQVRSHENDKARLFGYQIEIDPSKRAWSGGLYDEARRGWLDDLSDDALARAAFRDGEWNRYRIECVGPSIRAWVNDVPTADYLDAADLSGVIGLQVHSGRDTKVRWRAFRLCEFGRARWTDFDPGNNPRMLRSGNDDHLGSFPRKDRISLGQGGGLFLNYAFSQDRNARKEGSIERIVLAAPDWTWHAPLEGLDLRGGQVLILCHPPRLAIEVGGRRLAGGRTEAAARPSGAAIEAWIDYGPDLWLVPARALEFE